MVAVNKKELAKMLDSVLNLVEQIKLKLDESSSPEAQEAIKSASKGLCTYCGEAIVPSAEGKRVSIRGAHPHCHKKINRAINSLSLSDEQVVNRGWLLESDKGGRKYAEDEPLAKLELEAKKTTSAKRAVSKRKK